MSGTQGTVRGAVTAEVVSEVQKLVAKIGGEPTLTDFATYLSAMQPALSLKRQRNLRGGYEVMLKTRYVEQMAVMLPESPVRGDIAKYMAKYPPLLKWSAVRAQAWLRSKHPELWAEKSDLYCSMRFTQEGQQMLERFTIMLDRSRSRTVEVVMRALLLASSRREINLIGVLLEAKALKPDEAARLNEQLRYDLSKL